MPSDIIVDQTVVAVQKIPVSSVVPTIKQVLEYDGTEWTPTYFTATNIGVYCNPFGANANVNITSFQIINS